jgi:hypothetical protein
LDVEKRVGVDKGREGSVDGRDERKLGKAGDVEGGRKHGREKRRKKKRKKRAMKK